MDFVKRYWQWMTISAGVILAVVLGYWGLHDYFAQQGVARPVWDIGYFILYLFVIESGETSGPVPWQLTVARWLAAGVAFWAVGKAALALFRERLQSARPARWRGHVVICGLGRKGFSLAREFRATGRRVAVIECDPTNPYISNCRQMGAVVFLGDAADASLLARAGASRAKYFISIAGDDGANVAATIKLHQMREEEGAFGAAETTCIVHLVDPPLCELFKQHRIFREPTDRLDVRVFNTYESAARMLLATYPLEDGPDGPARRPHLAILGFGKMGQAVALQAAKIAHYASGIPLRITVVDRDAARLGDNFLGCYPQFTQVCEVEFMTAEIGSAAALARLREWALEPGSHVSFVVCLDGEGESIGAAMRIAAYFRDSTIPLYVRMSETTGLATLFENKQGLSQWLKNFHPFGMICEACQIATVVDKRLDKLAKASQEAFIEDQKKRGRSSADPAMQPWEHLDPAFRDSNRQQADHIPVKLRAIGCEAVSRGAPGNAMLGFEPWEIELMAKMEHARWNAERFLAGWTYGPERDVNRRISPHLVPWEKLPDEVREYDRDAARNIARLLTRTGEKVVRKGTV